VFTGWLIVAFFRVRPTFREMNPRELYYRRKGGVAAEVLIAFAYVRRIFGLQSPISLDKECKRRRHNVAY
jgi:hypothetical protein